MADSRRPVAAHPRQRDTAGHFTPRFAHALDRRVIQQIAIWSSGCRKRGDVAESPHGY
jgi:hypothetical protein